MVCVCACADFNDENSNVMGVCEQSDGVMSMDCSESDMLNDVVEIISSEFTEGEVCL